MTNQPPTNDAFLIPTATRIDIPSPDMSIGIWIAS